MSSRSACAHLHLAQAASALPTRLVRHHPQHASPASRSHACFLPPAYRLPPPGSASRRRRASSSCQCGGGAGQVLLAGVEAVRDCGEDGLHEAALTSVEAREERVVRSSSSLRIGHIDHLAGLGEKEHLVNGVHRARLLRLLHPPRVRPLSASPCLSCSLKPMQHRAARMHIHLRRWWACSYGEVWDSATQAHVTHARPPHKPNALPYTHHLHTHPH